MLAMPQGSTARVCSADCISLHRVNPLVDCMHREHVATVNACESCEAACRDAYLCPACVAALADVLAGIRLTLDDLDVQMSRQARTGESGPTARRIDPPMPYDIGASEARRRLYAALGALAPPDAGPWWVRASAARVSAQAGAGDRYAHLAAEWHAALKATDLPADHWYAGVCSAGPDVCPQDLYVPAGSIIVRCPRCRATHDVPARRTILLRHADDVMATATEISRAVSGFDAPLTASAVRRWAHRGLIVSNETSEKGAPMYRLGDVLDIMDSRRHALDSPRA